MQKLRVNRIHLYGFLWILSGCSLTFSSYYKLKNTDGDRAELLVTPDRIVFQCEKQPGGADRYGFIMHVLDDENTVTDVFRSNIIDREFCNREIATSTKILNQGKEIYLAGMGGLDDPKKVEKDCYQFPKGKFCGNGRSLRFMVIANEKGDCYHAYDGFNKPCPGAEFPIK